MRMLCTAALLLACLGCHSGQQPAAHTSQTSAPTPAVAADASPSVPKASATPASGGSSAAGHLATYNDPNGGVSFHYPDVWQAATPGHPAEYFGGEMPQEMGKPKAAFVFSPRGNVYEKTLLTSLSFSYYAAPRPTSSDCETPIRGNGNSSSTTSTTINGVDYNIFRSGDAGMCHRQASTIFVTYRNGVCYAFEGDTNTECAGAGDGKRPLTAAEDRALDRHMDDIFHSIRFSR